MKKILVVAAHPDDEVLGCGGALARLAGEGCSVYTLILGEGATSRGKGRNRKMRKGEVLELKKQAREANRILGVQEVFFTGFPDNRFDTISLLDIIKPIEHIKNGLKIDTIFTHHSEDLNIDHRITYMAVITATRPVFNESVKEVYSFEVPSSTEWNYPASFTPDLFLNIDATLDTKVEALKVYRSEMKDFPHPRSEEFVRLNARLWGCKSGMRNAEVFRSVRVIR